MRFSWLPAVLVGGVLLLSLSSCSDSTDVGLGVGPTPGGEKPKTLNVDAALDTTQRIPQTGWVANPLSQGGSSWRFLVGRVNDPIPGTGALKAEGYMDVSIPSSLPDRIENENDPDSLTAQLRLSPTYLHGDTASAVQIEVRNLNEESTDTTWASRQADDSFPAPTSATQGAVSVSPTDSLVTIDLPASWLTPDRLTTLQDTSQEFYGFKLTGPDTEGENLVVGFSSSSATLRLSHKANPDSITADYTTVKTFTHIEQVGTPGDPPQNHMLVQDGSGIGLDMSWDFDQPPLDTLRNDPLNAVQIFVPIDSVTMEEESMSESSTFARPLPKGHRIFVSRSSEEDAPLRLIPTAAPGAARVSDDVAFSLFRESLSNDPIFERLKLFVADRENIPSNSDATLNSGLPSTLPVLVQTDSLATGPRPPRATLTVTPL